MACYAGKLGVVSVGGTDVAEVKSWSLSESSDTGECTAMGDDYRKFLPTLKTWEGSMDVVWDKQESDADLAVGGDEVAIIVYPQTTGDAFFGNIIVSSYEVSAEMNDVIAATLSFTGTGALTRTLT